MNAATTSHPDTAAHKVQQTIKWIVYTLLIVNFVFYIFEDWDRAGHILDGESTFLDWAGEFATSIDESAWFLLLFMFELETYVLDDEELKGWVKHTVHGVRLFCYLMLAHTIYAYGLTVMDYRPTIPVENATSLCDLSDADVSYVYNLHYTTVDASTCTSLSDSVRFYWLADDPVVTDYAGLELERELAMADLIEAVAWLAILLSIEIVVRLQSQGVTDGAIIFSANAIKMVLYLALIGLGIYWATLSHWLYFWDELLWIGGFAAIEMNVSEWRSEIQDMQTAA